MLLSASLVLVVFLGVMGLVLDNAFRQSAEQAVSERLLLHIYALISASDLDQASDTSSLFLPPELQEPHFNTPGSGLFGLVFDADGEEIWNSVSALDLTLSDDEKNRLMSVTEPGVVQFDEFLRSPDGEPLFFLSYRAVWQDGDDQADYVYAVLENFDPYRKEVATFRNSLWGWLVAGVIVLVGLQTAIMSWGLLPIGGLEKDLEAIEAGEQDYLEGQYPKEIEGVTRNLNLLLEGERRQRERYRTTLADLAHSLKTPLAILKAEASNPDHSATITHSLDEQVNRMNEIVSYQLERALINSSTLVKQSVEVAPLIDKLIKTLEQVYRQKNIRIETLVEKVSFPGDERDFLELLGNLLDNACKYGRGKVRLFAGKAEGSLVFRVEDDGPGIEENHRDRVLERGTRLDSRETGQGIGLAVVTEIVDRYGGNVAIESSEFGGARITVSFED